MTKEKRYKMVYRCQMCGATLTGDEVAAPDGKPRFQLHGCADGSFGIGMLTGFEVVKDAKESGKLNAAKG